MANTIIADLGIKYPVLIPSVEVDKKVMDNLGVYPTTVFVDENGKVLKIIDASREKEDGKESLTVWLKNRDAIMNMTEPISQEKAE